MTRTAQDTKQIQIVKTAASSDTSPSPTSLAPITAEDVSRQTDFRSVERGRTYWRGGRIFNAIRRDSHLRANCRGSSGGPYLVEATLATGDKPGKRNPVSYLCSCPRGGFCKHVVALLLTWIATPEKFAVRQPVAEMLAGKSQAELAALIELMLRRHPELEEMIEIPVVFAVAADDGLVNEDAIRRQIAAAIPDPDGASSWDHNSYHGYGSNGYRFDYEYEEYGGLSSQEQDTLERILALGDAYAEVEHWPNVVRIAATFVEETAPELESLRGEDGAIEQLLAHCDQLLATCLDAQAALPADQRLPPRDRHRMLDAMLQLWTVDVQIGGLSLCDQGLPAIVRHATAEDRERVYQDIREVLAAASAGNVDRSWEKRAALHFLAELKGPGGLTDEELLEEYRKAGLWPDVVALLLTMGRIDESVSIATRRLPSARELIAFADKWLETAGPSALPRAIALADDRLWENEGKQPQDDFLLRQWLERRHLEGGEPARALKFVKERFHASPTFAVYNDARAIATREGQPGDLWPDLRRELLADLHTLGHWTTTIAIHLADGEVGDAIAALHEAETPRRPPKNQPIPGWTYYLPTYQLQVAAAAEENHPQESIRIYRRLAEVEIGHRSRDHYKQAAGFLARVKTLHESTGAKNEWASLISEVRLHHKSLRALREELDIAGLT